MIHLITREEDTRQGGSNCIAHCGFRETTGNISKGQIEWNWSTSATMYSDDGKLCLCCMNIYKEKRR